MAWQWGLRVNRRRGPDRRRACRAGSAMTKSLQQGRSRSKFWLLLLAGLREERVVSRYSYGGVGEHSAASNVNGVCGDGGIARTMCGDREVHLLVWAPDMVNFGTAVSCFIYYVRRFCLIGYAPERFINGFCFIIVLPNRMELLEVLVLVGSGHSLVWSSCRV